MSFPPPRKRHPNETEEEWNHVIEETKHLKRLCQLKDNTKQEKLTDDLNDDSDNDRKYSHITLQQNQQLHAEQIPQFYNNDTSILLSNDNWNEVDEQRIKKSKYKNRKKIV